MHSRSRALAALGVVAAVAIATSSCASTTPSDGTRSITIGSDIWALYGGWDPANGAFMSQSTQAVYDPLFFVAPLTITPEPWLASEFELSEDGLTLDVTLRDDVDFTDGTHLDAASLEEFFDTVFASEGFVWQTLAADWGTDATSTGEYTIRFTTEKPMSGDWFYLMSQTPISSTAALSDPDAFTDGPVGSGPYLLTDYTPEVSATFVRNPDYWNAEAFPYDEVTIKVFDDFVAGLNALKSGQVDATMLDTTLAKEAENSGFRINLGKGFTSSLAVFDLTGAIQPALADVRVRQALNLAFDRPTILETLNQGFGVASSQLVSEGFPGHLDGEDDAYGFDVAEARKLLAAAGYPDGFDITIPSTTGATVDTTSVEPIVQQALADIGVRVTFEPVAGDIYAYLDAVSTGRYPVVIMTTTANGSWGGSNYAPGWPDALATLDPDAAEWLEAAQYGTPAESAAAREELAALYLKEAVYVPFSQPAGIVASIPDVTVEVTADPTSVWLVQYQPRG